VSPPSPIRGAATTELVIIGTNIAHYEWMLKLDMDGKERSIVER
jgi:hypothetical protein